MTEAEYRASLEFELGINHDATDVDKLQDILQQLRAIRTTMFDPERDHDEVRVILGNALAALKLKTPQNGSVAAQISGSRRQIAAYLSRRAA
jgi:hypothetical protein